MATETSYTSLRENLKTVLDHVVDHHETVIVRQKSGRDVALILATELARLIETAHLLRSPRNARRLLTALRRAQSGQATSGNIDQLRREILGEARRKPTGGFPSRAPRRPLQARYHH